jgi:hypothetical protein
MFEKMASYVSCNSLISLFQSNFPPDYRTMIAFLGVCEDSRLNLELNNPTILVLLDFSKAFNSHGLFLLKLLSYLDGVVCLIFFFFKLQIQLYFSSEITNKVNFQVKLQIK